MVKNKKLKAIKTYDVSDTSAFIDKNKPLSLKDLGFDLPAEPPTRVVSIRLPTSLYNKIKSFATNIDMPYQAYIKYVLGKAINKDANFVK